MATSRVKKLLWVAAGILVFGAVVHMGNAGSMNWLGSASSALTPNVVVQPMPERGRIRFFVTTPQAGRVDILIYNERGTLVAVISERVFGKGRFKFAWKCRHMPMGVYYAQVRQKTKDLGLHKFFLHK